MPRFLGTCKPDGMGFVDQQEGAEFLAQSQDRLQGSHIPIHGKDRLGHHQAHTFVLDAGQLCTEVRKVVVCKFDPASPGPMDPIDQGGVGQGVVENHIVSSHEGRDRHAIGLRSGAEEQCAGKSSRLGKGALELFEGRQIS